MTELKEVPTSTTTKMVGAGLIMVIILGIIIIAASWNDVRTQRRVAQQDTELQYELAVANICVTSNILAIIPDERNINQISSLVDTCLEPVNTLLEEYNGTP